MRRTMISALIISGLVAQQACEGHKGPNPDKGGGVSQSTTSPDTTQAAETETMADVEQASTSPEYDANITESGGVKTETRIYKNNPHIARVVVTTRDGKRTAKVYSVSGEEKEIQANDLDNVLAKSGDAIADVTGFTADKAEDVGGKVVDAGKETVVKGKQFGSEVADKGEQVVGRAGVHAKTVGEKTAEGAKIVGKKTVEGAKKVGGAVKNAVMP